MIKPFYPEAHDGEGSWALKDLARPNTFISIAGLSGEGLSGDAFFDRFGHFCGATALYLDRHRFSIPSSSYIGSGNLHGLDLGTAQRLYADTVGTLRTMALTGLFADAASEANPDPWFSFVATATTCAREADLNLVATHLIAADDNGDFGDTFLYPQPVGDQVGLEYRDLIVSQLSQLDDGERQRAQQVLGRGQHMQRYISLLMAGMMPPATAMDRMSASYYQNRGATS